MTSMNSERPWRYASWNCWSCVPPAELRFVPAARHDVRLGLHRLRLEGGLPAARIVTRSAR
jgi:hypothetical protein